MNEQYTNSYCGKCKHDGGQNAYGSDCEYCSMNPRIINEFEPKEEKMKIESAISLAISCVLVSNLKQKQKEDIIECLSMIEIEDS